MSSGGNYSCRWSDSFPLSLGHCLIIPRRHFPSLFEATQEERAALWELLDQARDLLLTQHHPDGFNIGINDGIAAGQTVMHLAHQKNLTGSTG